MRSPAGRFALAVFTLASLFAINASATGSSIRVFVSSAGVDTGACTRSAPCRNFAYAIGQVAAGGEIVALDTAGYGAVTISQSVTIYAAPGAVASIASPGFALNLITISAGSSDTVTLRNLFLNSSTSFSNGVVINSAGVVRIANTVFANAISGSGGVLASLPADASLKLFLDGDVFQDSSIGVEVSTSGAGVITSNVTSCRFENIGTVGFSSQDNTRTSIRDSVFTANHFGVIANGAAVGSNAVVNIERTMFTYGDSHPVFAGGAGGAGIGTVRLAYCSITDNAQGVTGNVYGRFDGTSPTNTVEGNGYDGIPLNYAAK
jgi:hypothetical protein